MPTKTIAKCKPTTNNWEGIKTRQCTVTEKSTGKKSTDNLIWNIPQKGKTGQVININYCSDQIVRNRLERNGQEVNPLSVGVLRVHFTLDSTLHKQKREIVTSKLKTHLTQHKKIVIKNECNSVMRPRFYEDYSYNLLDNSFKKPFPQTKSQNEKLSLKTKPTFKINYLTKLKIKLCDNPDPMSIPYHNHVNTFRLCEMTGKAKEKKSGDSGPQRGQGQGGQGQAPQGNAPVVPPLPPQASASQGPTVISVTPTQTGGKKGEAAKVEQKSDKKSITMPNLDKPTQDKQKVTLTERVTATNGKTDLPLLTPEPNLNFYIPRATDNNSDAMYVDTEEEGDQGKGNKKEGDPSYDRCA